VTKLRESAIALNTNYMERRLFRRETIIINNLARSLLSELQNSNLRPKFLNCHGQDSSQKTPWRLVGRIAAFMQMCATFINLRAMRRVSQNAYAFLFFIYGDSNTHFDFILTKMSRVQSFLTIIQVNLLHIAFRNSRDNISDLNPSGRYITSIF